MPIHSPAYRAWSEQLTSQSTRWWCICTTGIRRSAGSTWLKRLMFAAYLPLLFFAIPFFLFEQAGRDQQTWSVFVGFASVLPDDERLTRIFASLPHQPTPEQFDTVRHDVWSYLLLTMLRYPQAFLMVVVIGIVAPPLISQDLRTRAYLIYFSRPISRREYIAGKVGVVSFFLLMVSAVPALILYFAGLLLSPSITAVLSTWDLPLRIAAASVCLVLPTTLVALAISSLTLESRYAGFAWFAIWIIGNVTYAALTVIPSFRAQQAGTIFDPGWRLLTSPYHVIGKVQSYVFGFEAYSSVVMLSIIYLGVVSLVALLILFRRVNAPMRA
jgi:ABC-2 type transport system permease protein